MPRYPSRSARLILFRKCGVRCDCPRCGGDESVETAPRKLASPEPAGVSWWLTREQDVETLTLFETIQPAAETFPALRTDLLKRIAPLAERTDWPSADRALLRLDVDRR